MQVQASVKNIRITPRKLRLFADSVRGLSYEKAIETMFFMYKSARSPMLKLVKSAASNATNNYKLSNENLYIKNIIVDEGPKFKRQAKGRRVQSGRGTVIKRGSHVTVILEEKNGPKN